MLRDTQTGAGYEIPGAEDGFEAQGLKPGFFGLEVAARLKSGPVTRHEARAWLRSAGARDGYEAQGLEMGRRHRGSLRPGWGAGRVQYRAGSGVELGEEERGLDRAVRGLGMATAGRVEREFLSHIDGAGMKFAQRRKDLRQWFATCAGLQAKSGAHV